MKKVNFPSDSRDKLEDWLKDGVGIRYEFKVEHYTFYKHTPTVLYVDENELPRVQSWLDGWEAAPSW